MGLIKFLFKTIVYGVFAFFTAMLAKVLWKRYNTDTVEPIHAISEDIEK